MHVTLTDSRLGIRAVYDSDPVDLICQARAGDYEVCLYPATDKVCRIVIEAGPAERATFDVIKDQPGVSRIFHSGAECVRELTRCLPDLYQFAHQPGAVFYTGLQQTPWPFNRLPELARYRTIAQLEAHHGQ